MRRLFAVSFAAALLLQACTEGSGTASEPVATKEPAKAAEAKSEPSAPVKSMPAAAKDAANASLDPALLTCRAEAESLCKPSLHDPKALANCLFQNKAKLKAPCKAAVNSYRAKHK